MRWIFPRWGMVVALGWACGCPQLIATAESASPAITRGGSAVAPVFAGAAQPFPLFDVRLLPGPFYDAMLRDQKYLLFLDPDRFLRSKRRGIVLFVPGRRIHAFSEGELPLLLTRRNRWEAGCPKRS